MIKPVKGLTPIYVRYWDNGEATVYNLTEAQYENLCESMDDATSVLEQFEVEQGYGGASYVQPFVRLLSELYGFEVDSE